MRVRDQMTSPVVSVSPETPLGVARAQLEKGKLRCLPVVEGHTLVGLLLAGTLDVALRDPATPVREVMRPPTAQISPKATLDRAAVLMLEHDVRGLPVVSPTGELVGVITVSDLLDAMVKAPPVVLWG